MLKSNVSYSGALIVSFWAERGFQDPFQSEHTYGKHHKGDLSLYRFLHMVLGGLWFGNHEPTSCHNSSPRAPKSFPVKGLG